MYVHDDGGLTTMVMMQEMVSTMMTMMQGVVTAMVRMMQGVVDSMCRCPPTTLPGEHQLFLFHYRPSWEDNDDDPDDEDDDDDDDEAQD